MPRPTAPLFRPFTVGPLTLPNRLVMAPMTRSFSPGGVPGDDVAAYYRRRAEDGVGLIVTEGTVVAHPAAANDPRVPRFHGDDALAGWAKVVAEVHDAGGRVMPQLWHVGTMRKAGSEPNPDVPPVGPSGLFKPERKVGEPMTEKEIADLIAAFARAAADAMRLGFDGIEIHGAHGYLIDQFFWEGTNVRDDAWGGDLVKRTRFAAEIVRACRRATSPDFPILLRFSQWKQQDYTARLAPGIDDLMRFLTPLADAGVDVFHCSTRRFWEPEFEGSGSSLNLAGWTKKLTGKPVITVGSVGLDGDFFGFVKGQSSGAASLDALIDMVAANEVDLVAVGRAMLADPRWVTKVREGRLSELGGFTSERLKTLV
ncbi:MAG: NADH:flavin oxidoreductase [Rhodospirillales bacterium]|nr:MAG: NADH:flavin oxidoreductase [Rhodospirillales bacterium]